LPASLEELSLSVFQFVIVIDSELVLLFYDFPLDQQSITMAREMEASAEEETR
jgi:hypothetical protein